MAVTIVRQYKFHSLLEHHRNPSGQNNKVKWLLEQSHRNVDKIHEIVSKIVMSGYDMISSWVVAEAIAIDIVRYGFKNTREYLNALREGKIYNKENKYVND